MNLLENRQARIIAPLLIVFLIVNIYVNFQARDVQIEEKTNKFDDIVFAAAEVDAAILDFISTYRRGVPDTLDDLYLSEPLKEVLDLEDVVIEYNKLSTTEYELIIKGLEDTPIIYKKISPREYELILEGFDEDPIIFSGGDDDHSK